MDSTLRLSVPESLWLTRVCFPFDTDAVSAGIPACGTQPEWVTFQNTGHSGAHAVLFPGFPLFLQPEDFLGCSVFGSPALLAISVIAVISKLARENKEEQWPHSSHSGMDVRIWCSGLF